MNIERLKILLELPGVSGRESKVAQYVEKHFLNNNLEITSDNLGSICGIKKSNKKDAKTIFIDAHMDEVGFLITEVKNNGTLAFEIIGGISKELLLGRKVQVYSKDQSTYYFGVIVLPSFFEQGTLYNKNVDDYIIDIGYCNKQDVEALNIGINSIVTYESKVTIVNNMIFSKAADNRIGVSLLCDMVEYTKDKEYDFNIIFSATTQEEVGLRGIGAALYDKSIDLSIVIDSSPINNMMSSPSKKFTSMLGNGTFLRHKDRLTIYSKEVIRFLENLLKTSKIKWFNYFSYGATNAGSIHLFNSGIPVIPVGFVVKYIHTDFSLFDINDYLETEKLLFEILNSKELFIFYNLKK